MRNSLQDRDLAGEATVRDAYRTRLHADISPEEADDDAAEREANGCNDNDADANAFWDEQAATYAAYHS